MALPNEPITKQEMYLSNIAGQNTALPKAPITREEMYLDYIAKNGGTGEGDMKKSVYDSDNSVATAGGIKMFVNQKIGTLPQRVGTVEGKVTILEGQMLEVENDLDNLGTASTKNSTSVVTESTDLVESGAVYQELANNDLIPNKNKLPVLLSVVKTLNTGGTWSGNTYTIGSLTLLFEEREGYVTKITVNGSSGNDTITIQLSNGWIPFVGGNYIVSGFGNENARTYVNPDRTTGYYDNGDGNAFTVNTELTCRLQIEANKSFTNIIVQPMIRLATESDPTYEPYYTPLKDVVPNKCDNSVIGTVEDGTTASQAYAVGSHFIRNGAFCTVTTAISSGESLVGSNKFTSGDVAKTLSCVKGFRLGTFNFSTTTGISVGNVTFDTPFPSDIDSTRIAVFLSTISGNNSFIFVGTVSNISLNGFSFILKNIGDELEANNRFCLYLAVAY